MTLEASTTSKVIKNTMMSPLGPPPSVVLMPKHIHQQFETQGENNLENNSNNTMIDNVLRDRNHNRRQNLRREMGHAMKNLKKKQLKFQKYMENRTTPPKHKELKEPITGNVGYREKPLSRNLAVQRAAKKQKYSRKKIELKRKRRKRRRKEYLKWKKYRQRMKEKRRRERYKQRKRKRSKKKRYDSDSGWESDSSYSTSSAFMTTSEEDMSTSSLSDYETDFGTDTASIEPKPLEPTSSKQVSAMKQKIYMKVKEQTRQELALQAPKGTFENSKSLPDIQYAVNNARNKRRPPGKKKRLPPMHSPPANVKKVNVIPPRPRLPDLQSLRKRNQAEGILLDAAIDRYRSTALTASLSLPQSTRPRNSQVCGLKGTLLSSPSMNAIKSSDNSMVEDTPRTQLRRQRKLNRHTLPGLKSIEEIRKRLSPISTPTSKWGFALKADLENVVSTPKAASRRQRSSTLSAISLTPTASRKAEKLTEKVNKAAKKEPISAAKKEEISSDDSPKNNTNDFQVFNSKSSKGIAKPNKKMNSNQQKFVKSLDKVGPTATGADQPSRLASPASKSRPKELLTYKKKAPPPLLTVASIKQSISSSVDVDSGITLNTDGSFVSNFSNGSPSIWL